MLHPRRAPTAAARRIYNRVMRYGRVFRVDRLLILRPATICACHDVGVVDLKDDGAGIGAKCTVNFRNWYEVLVVDT